MTSKSNPCWHCQKISSASRFFCSSCEKIQEPKQNYSAFELFLFPVCFQIDFAKLEVKYLQLSQLLHPDRFHSGSSREKLFASMHTANLNEAYKILKNTVKRGNHILEVVGYDVGTERTIKAPELLQEAFTDQEALDEVTSYAEFTKLIKSLQSRQIACFERISTAFSAEDYPAASIDLDRYRYYDKALEDAHNKKKDVFTELKTGAQNAHSA